MSSRFHIWTGDSVNSPVDDSMGTALTPPTTQLFLEQLEIVLMLYWYQRWRDTAKESTPRTPPSSRTTGEWRRPPVGEGPNQSGRMHSLISSPASVHASVHRIRTLLQQSL